MVKTKRPTLGLLAACAATVLISGATAAQDVEPASDPLEAPPVVDAVGELNVQPELDPDTDPVVVPAPPVVGVLPTVDRLVPDAMPRARGLVLCISDLPTRIPCLR